MIVLAHRGACWDAPENTLEAFELAIANEADYVEFDVRTARDGRLVVAHDPLRFDPAPGTPTLDQTLATLRGRVGLAVEIKEQRTTERVLGALGAHRIPSESVIVCSGRIRALELVRRRRPEVRCLLHLGGRPDPTAASAFWGVGFRDDTARPRQIALARSFGLAVTVWTVNDPARMRDLAALGVDGIFTDRPGLLRETMREVGRPQPEAKHRKHVQG